MSPPMPVSKTPDPSVHFRVGVLYCAGRTFVVPRGELDLASARVLDAVLAAQAGPVVLDLRELSFIDGTGLSLLTDAQTRSSMDGRRLSFIAGPAVAQLLALLELADPLTYA